MVFMHYTGTVHGLSRKTLGGMMFEHDGFFEVLTSDLMLWNIVLGKAM